MLVIEVQHNQLLLCARLASVEQVRLLSDENNTPDPCKCRRHVLGIRSSCRSSRGTVTAATISRTMGMMVAILGHSKAEIGVGT